MYHCPKPRIAALALGAPPEIPNFCSSPAIARQGAWTSVRFPQKGTVFDYYVNFRTSKFAPW